MKTRPKRFVEGRQEQETPAEMVDTLMGMIRGQFYADAHPREWLRDQHYIRREIILWPASWLKERGMVMDPVRYKALIVEKLQDVKRNCAQAKFTYFPAYLARCIRDHFHHNEDSIYEEAKALRGQLASVLGKLRPDQGPDLVDTLTAARDVLMARKRAKRTLPAARPTASHPAPQQELF